MPKRKTAEDQKRTEDQNTEKAETSSAKENLQRSRVISYSPCDDESSAKSYNSKSTCTIDGYPKRGLTLDNPVSSNIIYSHQQIEHPTFSYQLPPPFLFSNTHPIPLFLNFDQSSYFLRQQILAMAELGHKQFASKDV